MSNENSQTLTALQTAIQMEIDGKKYYLKLSQTGADESGRELFSWLAEQEDVHLNNFKQIFKAIEAKQVWPEIKLSAQEPSTRIFTRVPAGNKGSTATELKSIQKAMVMENKTLDFYLAQASKADYPLEKQYYEAVAAQERIHHVVLLDYYEFLNDPAQWHYMKERSNVDGG